MVVGFSSLFKNLPLEAFKYMREMFHILGSLHLECVFVLCCFVQVSQVTVGTKAPGPGYPS